MFIDARLVRVCPSVHDEIVTFAPSCGPSSAKYFLNHAIVATHAARACAGS